MHSTRSYHLRRERSEEAMSVAASSAVARIAHHKLAVLHGEAAGNEPVPSDSVPV